MKGSFDSKDCRLESSTSHAAPHKATWLMLLLIGGLLLAEGFTRCIRKNKWRHEIERGSIKMAASEGLLKILEATITQRFEVKLAQFRRRSTWNWNFNPVVALNNYVTQLSIVTYRWAKETPRNRLQKGLEYKIAVRFSSIRAKTPPEEVASRGLIAIT